jgi:hypothetical protein
MMHITERKIVYILLLVACLRDTITRPRGKSGTYAI